ncbi:MAG: hypothetical protein Q9179_004515 [Wetmoreana sp. 5 TL-2023]
MALAGIDHITLPPPLLQQLANLAPSDKQPSLFDQNLDDEQPRSFPSIETKDDFDRALRMSNGGNNQRKLDQALEIFSGSQRALEDLIGNLA